MSSSWEKSEIPNLFRNFLQQISGTATNYLSIWGRRVLAHIGSSWHLLSTSGTWFHDQVRSFWFEHQGVYFYSHLWNIIYIVYDIYNIPEYMLLTINCFYIIDGLNISNDFPGSFNFLPFLGPFDKYTPWMIRTYNQHVISVVL